MEHTPTMYLRWLMTKKYDHTNNEFIRILQQKWIADDGTEEWREIEIYDPK